MTDPTAPMLPQEIPVALRGGPEWDPERQAAMCREIAAALGFDSERGRMDVSIHPFTGGSHPADVRITTRYSADNWLEGLAGTIHDCGHAMYEQGRPASPAAGDLPAGEALGMAVHESQSLLWERMVAQGLPFWRWAASVVHRHFPHTKGCGPEDARICALQHMRATAHARYSTCCSAHVL
jgi:carboxypeptidase Taq